MTTNTAPFAKGLKGASTMLLSFEAQTIKTGHALRNLFSGALAIGAGVGIYKLVKAGSDLVENQNKLKEVFGQSADIIITASEKMSKAFGVSKSEFQDMSGKLGLIFQGVGYAAEDAAQLSKYFVKLALDASSFYNIPIDEALQKIEAGLVGQERPLRKLGVLLDDAAVKQYAYANSIAKVGAELTTQQKVQAHIALISQGLSKAQGDFAHTADEVANATRGMKGRIESLAETIGLQLQPIAKTVLAEMSISIAALNIAWQKSGVEANKSALATTGGIGLFQSAVGTLADTVQLMGNAWLFAQANATSAVASILEALAPYEATLKNMVTLAGALSGDLGSLKELARAGAAAGGLGKVEAGKGKGVLAESAADMRRAAAEQQKKAEKQAAAPKASDKINQTFKEAQDQLKKLRDDLAKDVINPNVFKPKEAELLKKEEKPHELHFAQAEGFGSQGATNAILRSRYGGKGQNKAAEEVAKNTGARGAIVLAIKELAKQLPDVSTPGAEIWSDFS